MEASKTLINTDDLGESSLPTEMEGSLIAAVLASALLAYRRRLALAGQEHTGTGSGAQWQTVARVQQLVPTAQHPLRRQG
jgi:hypothetical protein